MSNRDSSVMGARMRMKWQRIVSAISLPIAGALAFTLLSAGTAEAAGKFYKCERIGLSAAKKRATATCWGIHSVGGAKASSFRAAAYCDMDRGTGASTHSIFVWVYASWKSIEMNKKSSSVTCPLRSTLISGKIETK